jgi:membrane associated rhomboid family serine protease
MGFRERTYYKDPYEDSSGGMGSMRLGLPRPSRAVTWLLVANGVAFVLQAILDRPSDGFPLSAYGGVTVGDFWQVWRYVTFQFLHASPSHLIFNMMGLYFLGTPVEPIMGTRRFAWFYLACGCFAGLAYVVIGAAGHIPREAPIIGASGGVYAVLLAAAIYLPQIKLFFFIPMRIAAVGIFGLMILTVSSNWSPNGISMAHNSMGDVAHLGGAVAAAIWIWAGPRFKGFQWRRAPRRRPAPGRWQKKLDDRDRDREEVDRILQKVHDQGIGSLTGKERKKLQDETKKYQKRNRDSYNA